MAARSMWNGTLRCGELAVPVKLHAAVEDRTVRFHLLHDRDKQRVRQKLIDPSKKQEVPDGEVRRGYEVEPGVFVVLEDAELAALDPEPSKDIELTRFVPATAAGRYPWYERPYYLSPDGDARDYFALAAALAATGREGIARWVMRKKHYAGALRAEGGYLMLVAMRHAGEVIDATKLPAPAGPAPTAKEMKMAEQLIGMLEDEYDLTAFRDEYRTRLEDLIDAKSKGKLYAFERPAAKRANDTLEHALARSLTKLRKGRKSA
jgi:DNA end-binding protein Ku